MTKEPERRLDTLSQHITQYESRKQHRAVYSDAKQKDPKKREAYYAKHSAEIEAYKSARDYLNAVMNGRTDPPPIKDWQAEQKKLTAAKYALCERYYAIQDERSVEQLCKGAENIMRAANNKPMNPIYEQVDFHISGVYQSNRLTLLRLCNRLCPMYV